ncbi:hypothetical protein G7Y89_g6150 [Cudoniella acicularis]|uniref:Mid2 domain-containing protein n=1 Tax=Cudoniella acicularis TaxID=354080 RepID=A0A8H4RNG2_9HELO|nr:hypothetical protein G7Y89_g6150 [Cudoniella acicularis]
MLFSLAPFFFLLSSAIVQAVLFAAYNNEDAVVPTGTTQTLEWQHATGAVLMLLSSSQLSTGIEDYPVAPGLTGASGSYNWKIPTNLLTGQLFGLFISDSTAEYDTSNYFYIGSNLTLTSTSASASKSSTVASTSSSPPTPSIASTPVVVPTSQTATSASSSSAKLATRMTSASSSILVSNSPTTLAKLTSHLSTTATATVTALADSGSGSISIGAKAGIGAGIVLVVLALAGLAGLFLWKRSSAMKKVTNDNGGVPVEEVGKGGVAALGESSDDVGTRTQRVVWNRIEGNGGSGSSSPTKGSRRVERRFFDCRVGLPTNTDKERGREGDLKGNVHKKGERVQGERYKESVYKEGEHVQDERV